MTEESAADRQAAQQAREQEKKYGDSATAVSPDTQRADPTTAADGDISSDTASDTASGESARGESTVFGEPDQDAEPPTSGYGEQPERVTGAEDGAAETGGGDQDAEPSAPPYDQE